MVTRHSWRTVSPPTPESKTPTGRGSMASIVKGALAFVLVGRVRVLFVILAAALVCTGSASATSGWTEVTIQASDATPLACAYIIPGGTAPTGGWPGIILFHGLGQSRLDMEPIGSVAAQFGFAALACDARGTGSSGGKFGLEGPREV